MRLVHLRWTEPTRACEVIGEDEAIWAVWRLIDLVRRASQTPEAFKFDIHSIPGGTLLNPLRGATLFPYSEGEEPGLWE